MRDAALVATGGYGRGELYPCSDIDLLVLLADEPTEAEREALERLIGALWDIGLELGHSVRTVEDCIEAAAERHHRSRTTLLEARYLAGSRALFQQAADGSCSARSTRRRSSRRRSSSRSSATPSTRTRPTRSSRT